MNRKRVACSELVTTTKRLVKKGVVKLTTGVIHPIVSGDVYRDVKQVLSMETSRDTTYKAGKSKLRRNRLHEVDLQEESEENTQLLLVKII